MKLFSRIAVLLAFVSTAAAEAPPVSVAPPTEVRIGELLALTGPFADIGEDCRRGVEVGRQAFFVNDRIGDYKLTLLPGDTQADPKIGLNEFRKVVDEEHAVAIITMRSPIGMALNPVSKAKHIPLLGAVGHSEFPVQNEYAFAMWAMTSSEGKFLADAMLKAGHDQIAMLTAEDDWTVSVSKHFTEAFTKLGGKILYADSVPGAEVDFAPIATKLRSSHAKAFFINLGLTPGALAVKRIREQGMTQKIYSNFWTGDPNAIASAGAEVMEDVSFAEAKTNFPKFRAALDANFPKKRISSMTYSCYSSMGLLAVSLSRLSSKQGSGPLTSDQLYQALIEVKEIPLLDGTLAMAERRAQFELTLKTIRGGAVSE